MRVTAARQGYAIAAVLLTVVAVALLWPGRGGGAPTTPAVSASPAVSGSPPLMPSATPPPSGGPLTHAEVLAGPAVEVSWPALAARLPDAERGYARVTISAHTCPVTPEGLIDPDRANLMQACSLAGAGSWAHPGSSSTGMALLAGHTWRFGPAAFNGLYDWQRQEFRVREGDEMWIRTQTSGETWLVYRAVSFDRPGKFGVAGSLAALSQEWDTHPVPGRVFTVGCLQPNDLAAVSTQNIVIGWDYLGTRG